MNDIATATQEINHAADELEAAQDQLRDALRELPIYQKLTEARDELLAVIAANTEVEVDDDEMEAMAHDGYTSLDIEESFRREHEDAIADAHAKLEEIEIFI